MRAAVAATATISMRRSMVAARVPEAGAPAGGTGDGVGAAPPRGSHGDGVRVVAGAVPPPPLAALLPAPLIAASTP